VGDFFVFRNEDFMTEFKVLGVNHLGLAAKDSAKCRWFLSEVLGLSHHGDEVVTAQKTMTEMFSSAAPSLAQARLEIVSPMGGSTDGPISKYLEKKGGGIHHMALTVNSLEAALRKMKEKGVRMIDEAPRAGAHQTKIAFVHPESTGGILVELVEETSGH
jgi:methylmalonyl-CoA/ethylmalonyl-CoA epimerase